MRQSKTLIVLCLWLYLQLTHLAINKCSSQNTGASGDSTYSLYQSNGACEDVCKDSYLYLILQGFYCWCSNYAPGETTDVSDCDDSCPGYPTDKCGNTDDDLFLYIQLGNPSGTISASASQTSESSSSSKSSSSSSETSTSTSSSSSELTTTSDTASTSSPDASSASPTITSSSADSLPSSSMEITSSSSKSKTSSSTSSDSPETTVVIKTITGSAATTIITTQVTVPSSSSSSDDNNNNNNRKNNSNSKNSFWSSPGKVAGTFVVVGLVILLLILLLIWFFFLRRRNANDSSKDMSDVSSNEGNDLEKMFNSQNLNQYGNLNLPVMVDQRLDPNSMMFMNLNNSKKSLGDDVDYSRKVLRVVND